MFQRNVKFCFCYISTFMFIVQNPVGNRIVLLIMDVYRLAKQVTNGKHVHFVYL